MATGKMPFDGASSGEICGAILRDEPKLPSQVNRQVSPGLEAVIRKALEKDRNLRYQHESEMRTDLQRLKRDTDSSRQVPTAKGHANAVPAAAQPAHSSSSSVVIEVAKRHKWTVASGLVAVLIVLAAAAIGIYHSCIAPNRRLSRTLLSSRSLVRGRRQRQPFPRTESTF